MCVCVCFWGRQHACAPVRQPCTVLPAAVKRCQPLWTECSSVCQSSCSSAPTCRCWRYALIPACVCCFPPPNLHHHTHLLYLTLSHVNTPPHTHTPNYTPFLSPSVREALSIVSEEGLESLWARHLAAHNQLWEGLSSLGLKPFVEKEEDR